MKTFRQLTGLSQEKTARLLNISLATVNRIEQGRAVQPDNITHLLVIASALYKANKLIISRSIYDNIITNLKE